MWFHLLSVAALIAVDSCLGSYHGLMTFRGGVDPACLDSFCPCHCPSTVCIPCIIPISPDCLSSCGGLSCPCPKPDNHTSLVKEMARGVSTINVYPTGPICSGINIAFDLVLTVSNCVLGKPIHQLYVTVNTKPTVEALKVRSVIIDSHGGREPSFAVLHTEKPKKDLLIYGLPPNSISHPTSPEYHKWEVLDKGRVYKPTRTESTSYNECKIDGKNRLCVEARNVTKMGWNDIGTPFVDAFNDSFVAYGLYSGVNLYKINRTIVYLPIHEHMSFLVEALKHSGH